MQRNFKGVWIPVEIYLHQELSWTEKILLTEIHSLSVQGSCFASNASLAQFLQVSEKTVANTITSLRKRGYLKVTGNGGFRVLDVTLTPNPEIGKSRNRDKTVPKSGTPPTPPYKDNNTVNNTPIISVLPPRNKKGCRLPSDFTMTDEMAEWAESRGLRIDLATETEKFCNYWAGVAGAKGVKLDWVATWRNWMLNAEGYQNGKTRQNNQKTSNIDRLSEYEAMFAKYGSDS